MAKGKGWVKAGSTRVPFLQVWKFPQDIQGFITSLNTMKARKKGWGDTIEAVIAKNDGDSIKISRSVSSPVGIWLNKKKEGEKVRIVYLGGNFEGMDEEESKKLLSKVKTYKDYQKIKGKKNFYPDFEFYNAG